jgi:hypothetical protein
MSRTALARLRAQLRFRKRLERRAKRQHARAQARLDEARRHDFHPRQPLIDARDAAARKLEHRREQVAEVEERLGEAGALRPKIITSAQLGLRFQWLWGGKGGLYRGAGHYTAGARARDAGELAVRMREIHNQHASQGWGGGSYEAVFADDGTIGLLNPVGRKSAAVASNNTGLTNLCVPGTTGDRITPACQRSIRWYLANAHTRKVPKTHRLPRPARVLSWRGHREYPGNPTACPGVMLGDYKEIWR